MSTLDISKIKYHTAETIGSGAFGSVYRVELDSSKPSYIVMKEIDLSKYEEDKKEIIKHGEIDVYKFVSTHCDCSYITKYLGHIYIGPHKSVLRIFMEYIENQITEILENRELIVKVFPKCVHALYELHMNKVIHRDIKIDNILYNDKTLTPKISDFGAACKRGAKKCNDCVGTREYLDPFALASADASGKCKIKYYYNDMYSLGVTFYKLFYGTLYVNPSYIPIKRDEILPFFESHYTQKVEKINNDIRNASNKNIQKFLSILINLLNPIDPAQRFSAADILNTYYKKYTSRVKSISPIVSTSASTPKLPQAPLARQGSAVGVLDEQSHAQHHHVNKKADAVVEKRSLNVDDDDIKAAIDFESFESVPTVENILQSLIDLYEADSRYASLLKNKPKIKLAVEKYFIKEGLTGGKRITYKK